jgi:hypothetical protein
MQVGAHLEHVPAKVAVLVRLSNAELLVATVRIQFTCTIVLSSCS